MVLLDSGMVATNATCCCGGATTGACCATDGSGCTITTEAGCSGIFYGVGTTCDGFICAFNPGGDCHCALFSPFEDGLGGYWTRKDTDCFGAVTYSGATTVGTLYIDYALHLECCSPGGTIYDCVQHSFLDSNDLCNLFESDPCFVSPDPCFPGTGNTFGFEEVSHLVDDPCP